MSFPSDLEISRAARMLPITEIAAGMGLEAEDLELYGPYKAKIRLSALEKLADRPKDRLFLATFEDALRQILEPPRRRRK